MKKTLIAYLLSVATLLSLTDSASADEQKKTALETNTGIGMGGPVGLAILATREDPSTKPLTFHVYQRFSSPGYSGLALELNAVLPCGAGANMLFDAYHTDSFRLHLFDPGIFYNSNNSAMNRSAASVDRLSRRWDVTFGLGADLLIKQDVWVTADWRVFMPDPILLSKLGGLARPYVDESLKGGNLWLGMAFTW